MPDGGSNKHNAEIIMKRYENACVAHGQCVPIWKQVDKYFGIADRSHSPDNMSGRGKGGAVKDSVGFMAAQTLISALTTMCCGQQNDWFCLSFDTLSYEDESFEWLEQVNKIMKSSFSAANSNFYNVIPQFFSDIVHYGNAVSYDEYDSDKDYFNEMVPSIKDVVVEYDIYSLPVGVFRKVYFTALQVKAHFPEVSVPEKITTALDNNSVDKFSFIHFVGNNEFYNPSHNFNAAENKPYVSVWIFCDDKPAVFYESGYYEMPYYTGATNITGRYGYGCGYAEMALPHVKQLNKITDDYMAAMAFHARPPLMTRGDPLTISRVKPGDVVAGGIGNYGRPDIAWMQQPNSIPVVHTTLVELRQAILDIFMFRLMQLKNRTGMTVSEIRMREAQEAQQIVPLLSKIQADLLTPKTNRRFQQLLRNKKIPPPPDNVDLERIEVSFTSEAQRVVKSQDIARVMQYTESIITLSQTNPDIIDVLDFDKIPKWLAEQYHVPASIIRDSEQIKDLRTSRQEQAQSMQAAQLAPQMAGALKQVAEASQIANADNASQQASDVMGKPI